MTLFLPHADTDWPKVLSLPDRSAKFRILRDLLDAHGSYLHGWTRWRGDWRKRISELRRPVSEGGLGVPIVDRWSAIRQGEKEYAIPQEFNREYYDRLIGRRRSA